jgi:formate/nitrite transporter FocA (FNT family)
MATPKPNREKAKSREPQPPDQESAGTRLSAHEIYENISEAAEEELDRPAPALLWSALAAGLTIGFSFLAGTFLAGVAPRGFEVPARAIGYPLGFIFVVLARNQLFTENTLEPIIPLLKRPSWGVLRKVLALWTVVLAGNLVGAVIFGHVAAKTPMLEGALQQHLLEAAREVTSGGFVVVAYKAIYAGWLIALMAWLVASTHATGAQVALIWLTTAPIAAFGFRHSIAGAVEAFYRASAGDASWTSMLGAFVAPAVLGNIVGGVLLVALLNHGQVALSRGKVA